MGETREFGTTDDGRPVTSYTLTAEGGPVLRVLDLGATVHGLALPDDPGTDLVLGWPDASGYLGEGSGYIGATVGRFANRIGGAAFELDGVRHEVGANEGANCLHGGPDGFNRRLWTVVDAGDSSITFELVSPDGDQGFPGEVVATARYTASADGVDIELSATTDAPTVLALTNHAYFTLGGAGSGTVDRYVLTVDADGFLPVDGSSIPLGHVADVAGTPFDFRDGAQLLERVRDGHEQIGTVGGIDHAFVLSGTGRRRAARLEDPASGRFLEVHTDQPALQVYTGNMLDGRVGATGHRLRVGDGIAMETEAYPDAPNQEWMPSVVLRPGETWRSWTRWVLGRS